MEIINFDTIAEYETPLWHQKMEQCGTILRKNCVGQVIFVHGTFVGGDPLGFFSVLKSFGLSDKMTQLFEHHGKKLTDKAVDDLGNFVEDYNLSFAKAINNNIDSHRFIWNSENNHIGRLLSVIKLASYLADLVDAKNNLSENGRLILIGHSHAGQLFALLTVFLENGVKAKDLLDVVKDINSINTEQFSKDLKKISNIHLDMVTLGTPIRYRWGNYNKYNLLNLVNHRFDSTIEGVFSTKDGDYIQQWGIENTDLLPAKPSFIKINNKLDQHLDKGVTKPNIILFYLYKLFTKKTDGHRRQAIKLNGDKAGTNFFIDYKDNENDPVETLFGHGVYTKRDKMLFNLSLITKFFYNHTL